MTPALLLCMTVAAIGDLRISELMASNATGLRDEDGDYSDWVEIHNAGNTSVDLGGWYLTDDAESLTRWLFPAISVPAGGYLVVFASGKDRADATNALHTSFQLDADGEYLALVRPDGETVEHAYTPAFPAQRSDLSYGMNTLLQTTALVFPGHAATAYIPTNGTWDGLWIGSPGNEPFDDSATAGWIRATNGFGFSVGGATIPAETRGYPLQNRSITDTASGSVFVFPDITFTEDGQVLTWRFFSNDAGTVGRTITPLVFTRSGGAYAITGIGRTRTNTGAGQQSHGFDLTAGSALVQAGVHCFGFKDGSNVADNQGVVAFDNNPSDTCIWFGGGHAGHLSVGSTFTPNLTLNRTYSIEATTGTDFGRLISTDLESQMHAVSPSCFMRTRFELDAPIDFDGLRLGIRFEDGFIAYLNGVEVARSNVTGSPGYGRTADADRAEAAAAVEDVIDLDARLGLLRDGTNVLAVHGLNDAAANDAFLIHPWLTATRYLPQTELFFTMPTPGTGNVGGVAGFVDETTFSVGRGFHTQAFDVVISSTTPDSGVYVTTNGTVPSPSNPDAALCTGAIHVARTTVLRAAAFRNGFEPTDVNTHTFIFLEDVVQQDTMWPVVTQDPEWGPQLTNALRAIPTVALATASAISEVETGISMEFIQPDGTPGFQVNAGVEYYGGHSLNYPKKSMRISFKRQYGRAKLRYNLFDGVIVDEFDQVLLRGASHDGVFYANGTRGIYVRNRWVFDRQIEMGHPAPRGRFVHVYINGVYWGQHHLMERPDAAFMAYHCGGEAEEYDVLNKGVAIDGGDKAWTDMIASTTRYDDLQQYLDVVNYADYMLLQFYCGNDWDWNHYQNWVAARKREPGTGFKFFAWDSDMVLRRSVNANVIDRGGPGNMWGNVRQHPEFRMLLADRAHRLFFNNGMLTPHRVESDLDAVASGMSLSLIAEAARWGPAGSAGGTPWADYTPDTWRTELNSVLTAYVPQRTHVVIQQLRDALLLPDTDPPEFLIDGAPLHGGIVTTGSALTISNPNAGGTTYFTLNGTDPRWTGGAVAPGVSAYVSPITLTRSLRVRSRVLDDSGEWSALSDAVFTVPTAITSRNLVLSELHFNPSPPSGAELAVDPGFGHDDFEFIELWNRSSQTLDLGGLAFVSGVGFTFPSPCLLGPDEYIVVAGNLRAFGARYGTNVTVAGQYLGNLSDSGETVGLRTTSSTTVLTFTYTDGFTPLSDGDGPSMVFNGNDYAVPCAWRDSVLIGGTPGRAPDVPSRDVVINEVMSHTDPPDVDAVELLNVSTNTVVIQGWWLSDSRSVPRKFVIPHGSALVSGECLVIDEDDFNPTPAMPATNHFSLNGAHGDDVWLIEPGSNGVPRRIVDTVEFGAAANGETFGRWPDAEGVLYPMTSATLGTANSGPRVGPVVISECMYSYPGDTNGHLEFLEIYNPSDVTVPLANWRVVKGIEFSFSPEDVLMPSGTLVLVSFDPLIETQRLSEFRAAYGIDERVALRGPFYGRLDNSGEDVRLSRPDEPPLEEPSYHPALLEDEVAYRTTSPWPLTCLEGGDSVNRLNETQWGRHPLSWYGGEPSPGTYHSLPLAGFALWQRSAFPFQTPAEDRGWLADANGNGQVNALAYAFGFNPLSQSNAPSVFTGMHVSTDGLDVSYRRRLGVGDVVYRVELSGDRIVWDDSGRHVAPYGDPVPRPDGITETSTFRVDLNASLLHTHLGFIRLKVERAAPSPIR